MWSGLFRTMFLCEVKIINMTKHKYYASGICTLNEKSFKGICIAMDIKEAIDIFRDKGYSVHKIERGEQVNCSEDIGILLVEKTTIISRNRKGNA